MANPLSNPSLEEIASTTSTNEVDVASPAPNKTDIANLNKLKALYEDFKKINELVEYFKEFSQLVADRLSKIEKIIAKEELTPEEKGSLKQLRELLLGLNQGVHSLSNRLTELNAEFTDEILKSKIKVEFTDAQGLKQEKSLLEIEDIKSVTQLQVKLIKSDGSQESINIENACKRLEQAMDKSARTEIFQLFTKENLINIISHKLAIVAWENNNKNIVQKLDAPTESNATKRNSLVEDLKKFFSSEDDIDISKLEFSTQSNTASKKDSKLSSYGDFFHLLGLLSGRIVGFFTDIHKQANETIFRKQQATCKNIARTADETSGQMSKLGSVLSAETSQNAVVYQALFGDDLKAKKNMIVQVIKEITNAKNDFSKKLKQLENLEKAVCYKVNPIKGKPDIPSADAPLFLPYILSARADLFLVELKKNKSQADGIRAELVQLGQLINFNINNPIFKDNCIAILAQLATDSSFALTEQEKQYIQQSIASKIHSNNFTNLKEVDAAIKTVQDIAKPNDEKGLSEYANLVRPHLLNAITELENLIKTAESTGNELQQEVEKRLTDLREAVGGYPTEKAYLEVLIALKLTTLLEPNNQTAKTKKTSLAQESEKLTNLLGLNVADPDTELTLYDLLAEQQLGKKDLFFQLMDEHFEKNKYANFRMPDFKKATQTQEQTLTTFAKEGHDKSLFRLGELRYSSSDNKISPHHGAIHYFRLAYLHARDEKTKNEAFDNFKKALQAIKDMGKAIPDSPSVFKNQEKAPKIRCTAILAAELEIMKPKVGFSFFSQKEPATRQQFLKAKDILLKTFSQSNDLNNANDCLTVAETLQKAAANSQEKVAIADTVVIMTDLINKKLKENDSSVQPKTLLRSLQLLVTCCKANKSLVVGKENGAKPQQALSSENPKASFFNRSPSQPVKVDNPTLTTIEDGLRTILKGDDKAQINEVQILLARIEKLATPTEKQALVDVNSECMAASVRKSTPSRQPSA